MKHLNRYMILLAIALALCLTYGTAWSQRGGTDVTAEVATLDECRTDVEFRMTQSPYHTDYAKGDPVGINFHAKTGTLTAERVEVTISYAATNMTYVSTDTAGYPRPWGTADWVITHDGVAKTITAIVNIGAGNAVVLDHTLFKLNFTYGCASPGNSEWVTFENVCVDESNSIDHAGFHYGAQTISNVGLSSWDRNWTAIYIQGDASGPGGSVTAPLQFVSGRVLEGGFSCDISFDDDELAFQSIDQTGGLTEGMVVNHSVTVVAGDKDTLHISCAEDIGQAMGWTDLLYVKFTNNIPTHHGTSQLTVSNAKATDCIGEYSVAGNYANIEMALNATITVGSKSLAKNTSGSVNVAVRTNFPIHMATENGRALVNFDVSALNGKVTLNSVTSNTVQYWYWTTYTTPAGDFGVMEDPLLASSVIPADEANDQIMFTLNFTAGSSCGSGTFVLLAGLDPEGCRLAWADDETEVIHSVGPDYDLTLVNGSVSVTGCSPPPPASCPYLSVWNGSAYVDQNTILTQSELTAEGAPVVDHYALTTTPELVDGHYVLRIEEREDETTYLDQVRLLVAEGQPGRPVSVTPEGKFFYTEQTLRPKKAVDYLGKDITAQVQARDGEVYRSNEPGWLIVTYEPEGDETGSIMLAQGEDQSSSTGKCDPPIGGGINKLADTETEDFIFSISYRENGGVWVPLQDGPPRKLAACEFTETGMMLRGGSIVEVKYEWRTYWSVDDLTMIVASAEIPQVIELEPATVFQNGMGKVAEALDRADNEFVVLNRGEFVELQFPAGRRPDLSVETHFVIAAKGYYVPYTAQDGTMLPNSFALHPNYPNPLNAQTNISFALPVQADVNVVVFNVLGQIVKTIAAGTFAAGEHTVNWDGTNEQGNPVASGTYFIRMKSGEFEQQRKMTLLK